jgi:hypothetical protein
MRKLIAIFAIAALTACGNASTDVVATDSTTVSTDSTVTVDTTVSTVDSAK